MTTTPDPRSLFRRLGLWLSTPVQDVVRAQRTGRGFRAICLPSRLALSPLPTSQLKLIDRIARKASIRPAEREIVCQALVSECELAQVEGKPSPHDFRNRRQRKALIQGFRLERDRRHPWDRFLYRTTNAIGLLFLVLLVGYPLWVGTRTPTAQTDYLAQLNSRATAVDETDRAWPGYREAILALDQHLGINYSRTISPTQDLLRYGLQPGDPLWQQMRIFLTEHSDTLADIDRAARQPGLGFVLRSDNTYPAEDARALWGDSPYSVQPTHVEDLELYYTLLPQIGPLRQLALLKAAETHASLEDQDAKRFFHLITTLNGLAEHVSETPLLINAMTGVSIDTLKIHLLEDLLREDRPWLSDEDLSRLAVLIDRQNTFENYRYEGEFLIIHDLLQHSYTDNGRGDGSLTRHGIIRRIYEGHPDHDEKAHPLSPYIGTLAACYFRFTAPSRKEMYQLVTELETLVAHDYTIPIWESEKCEADAYMEVARQNIFVQLFNNYTPLATHTRRHIVHLAETRRQAVATVVALERYRRAHGDWPARLEQLLPHFLTEVPRDPANGKAMQYTIRNGRPLLYSLGVDGDDDGGNWPLREDDSWRYIRPVQKPDRINYVEDNRSASDFHHADAHTDGDWVVFPTPIEPPAELPHPDNSHGYGYREYDIYNGH